jgi:hypothetical protein
MTEAGAPAPVVPDYGGACVSEVVPAILGRAGRERPGWLPEPLHRAAQVVLLVVDGLGWEQLQQRRHLAPTLASMAGGPITTVAPSTTATALTSLATGAPPAVHGVVGYRLRVPSGSVPTNRAPASEVLNVLRWTTPSGDARERVPPESIQPIEPVLGTKPAVVTRSEFAESGFTRAHLAGSELYGWRYPSTLVVRTRELVDERRPFVYVYYPGLDTVAHEFGFGPAYDAELAAVDRLVADLLGGLRAGAVLAVVADHGQVDVGDRLVPFDRDVIALTTMLSGEGRFRWLHAQPGLSGRLLAAARERHSDLAWVRGVDEVIAEGWLGRPLNSEPMNPETRARLGDVAVVAHAPIAFYDPADTGSFELKCRHGSLTSAEVLVPLLAAAAPG